MKRTNVVFGALLGGATAAAVVAVSYLGEQAAGLPFLPFDIFDWMARVLPGGLITFTIDLIVMLIQKMRIGDISSNAKLIEQSIAVLQLLAGGAVFGGILALLGRRRPEALVRYGFVGGAILLLATLGIEASLGFPGSGAFAVVVWLAALLLPWGMALGWLVGEAGQAMAGSPEAELSRRQFIYLVGGGLAGVTIGSYGLGRILGRSASPGGGSVSQGNDEIVGAANTSGPAASPPSNVLEARIAPAPGTRPELTANEDFYRIDINTRPPEIDASNWQLVVEGLVTNRLVLTLDQIRALPSSSQVVTMQCISNPIGGDLTSTSRWTGTRLKDLLAMADVRQGAEEVYIESADGFYESVAMEDMMDERTLLVYAMNDEPLPFEHGYPLRIYIPNRYGMKQPKWIVRMELIDRQGPGYWVERGWSAEARPRTVSVVDTVAMGDMDPDKGTIPVGGIAWAGSRGISKVEVSVDNGDWMGAELRDPPLSPLSWVQWRYDWPAESGRHTFKVRSYDGAGQLQITESNPTRPDGATGIHSLTVRI